VNPTPGVDGFELGLRAPAVERSGVRGDIQVPYS